MDGETLLIIGGIALLLMHSNSHDGQSAASSGPGRVTSKTTTQVVDNDTTRAASTAVEVANDAKIVVTDGVDVVKSVRELWDDSQSDD